MTTECNSTYLDFPMLGSREVLADFDGGDISSDGGALLLREDRANSPAIIRQFAACFTDHRNPDLIEHSLEELIAQRVYGLALGYEDLNDHDDLRTDPLLAAVVGKPDPTGKTRQRQRDRGKALAGKSTLNRLELTPVGADKDSRYKKIVCPPTTSNDSSSTLFLQAHAQPAGADRPGPRRHRRPDPRPPTRPLLPRLLQELLLSAAVHLLRRPPALRPAAARGHRRRGRVGQAPQADRGADPRGVAGGQDRDPRRQRVLPRADHALV